MHVSTRLGIIYNFEQTPYSTPTPLIPRNRRKNQPDGSQTDLFPHKQHEYRRHGTQMEYMPDID